MPERPAAVDTTLPPTLRRLLLVAASVTLAFLCWFLLDEGDSLNAQTVGGQTVDGQTVESHPLGPHAVGAHTGGAHTGGGAQMLAPAELPPQLR